MPGLRPSVLRSSSTTSSRIERPPARGRMGCPGPGLRPSALRKHFCRSQVRPGALPLVLLAHSKSYPSPGSTGEFGKCSTSWSTGALGQLSLLRSDQNVPCPSTTEAQNQDHYESPFERGLLHVLLHNLKPLSLRLRCSSAAEANLSEQELNASNFFDLYR